MTDKETSLDATLERVAQLQKELEEAKAMARAAAVAKVREYVASFGIKPEEIYPGAGTAAAENAKPARSVAKPKYITPDGSRTWSGRGFMPKVFRKLINDGTPLESLLISK